MPALVQSDVYKRQVVKNLTVTGTWEPSGGKSTIGGIVGHNSGTIENCMFNGVVDGKNNIGGIAGINENTGVITGCTAVSYTHLDVYKRQQQQWVPA